MIDIVVALAHFIGAVVACAVTLLGVAIVSRKIIDRLDLSDLRDKSISLNLPLDDLLQGKHNIELARYHAEKFSSELFRNRFSDLCGSLANGLVWIGVFSQVAILIGAAWSSITEDPGNAVAAWLLVPNALFFVAIWWLFTALCWLIFGRYPGQARVSGILCL